jgi:hypothetical protein
MCIFRKEVDRRVVYKNTLKCEHMFVGCNYRTLSIITTVIVKVYKNIFGKYSVKFVKKQRVPLVKHPIYDGEFSTNNVLKMYAKEERALRDDWIYEHFMEIKNAILKENNL